MKHWAIQTNIINDKQADAFGWAVKGAGGEPHAVKLTPFSDELVWPEGNPDTTELIPYGSTKLVKLAVKLGWQGVFFNDNFNVRAWQANHHYMLNMSEKIVKVRDLDRGAFPLAKFDNFERFFIRPVEDLKAFAGTIATVGDMRRWRTSSVFGNFDVPEDTEVIICPVQDIECEHRWVIVNGKIIEGRKYRNYGQLCNLAVHPSRYEQAQGLAAYWLPHQNCVMDTAITREGMRVIEFNCLNCSGLYGHDPVKIVKAIHEMRM